jgi:predicted ArsR family transcriptional regulator
VNDKNRESLVVLDAILHQPIRTRIVAYLVSRGETTFMELKRVLEISDGNLESHLKKLISADYIITRKEGDNRRPQTLYTLTNIGHAAFSAYLTSLQNLLGVSLQEEENGCAMTPKGIIKGVKLGWDS